MGSGGDAYRGGLRTRAAMKLLVVSHPCATAANQVLFAEMKQRPGWDVTLAIPAAWRDEFGNVLDQDPVQAFADSIVRVPVWASGSIVFHLYRSFWTDLLRRVAPDAIYMHHEPYAPATGQVALANQLGRMRAVFGFYSAQNIQKNYPPPFSWIERFVYRASSFAFAVSEEVAGVVRKKAGRDLATVCPLPVDPELYFPRGSAADAVLVPRDGAVVAYVGRLTEAKGLRTLAGALGRMRDIPWKLLVIGTGDFENEFRRLLADGGVADRVEFKGYVPHHETPAYLSAVDVLVVPSETQPNWKEQFGRVIVEAMACGTPVVGSSSGEIPNLIAASGGGVVFPERDPQALSRSLRELISSEPARVRLASSGRKWVLANVALPAVAERMAAVIEAAVDRRSRP